MSPNHLNTCSIILFTLCLFGVFTIEKLSDKISLIVACCMYYLVSLLALVGSDCVSFILFTTLENEEGELVEEAYFNSFYYQDQDKHLHQGRPSKCLLLLPLSLSIMHGFASEVLQNMVNKTIYDVAITTINIT